MKGFTTVKAPGYEGLYFKKDVARVINNLQLFKDNSEVAHNLLQGVKEATALLKRYTTVLFPDITQRYSSVTCGRMACKQSWTLGICKGTVFAGHKRTRKVHAKNQLTGEMMDGKRLIQAAHEFDVTGADLVVGNQISNGTPRKASWNPLSKDYGPVIFGQNTSKYISDSMRLANFIHLKAQGFSDADAALRTKQALFDYNALSPTEKKISGGLVPYFAWSRNNIPFQMKELLHQPGQLRPLVKHKTK